MLIAHVLTSDADLALALAPAEGRLPLSLAGTSLSGACHSRQTLVGSLVLLSDQKDWHISSQFLAHLSLPPNPSCLHVRLFPTPGVVPAAMTRHRGRLSPPLRPVTQESTPSSAVGVGMLIFA